MNSDLLNRVDSSLRELREHEKDFKTQEYKHYALNFMQQALNYIYYKRTGKNKDIEINNEHDLNKIDSKDISDAIQFGCSLENKRIEMIKGFWNEGIAPAHIIQQDFSDLINEKIKYTSVESQVYAWVLAITGHAANGHGAFKDRKFRPLKYPNTTVNDILNSLSNHEDIPKFIGKGLISDKNYFNPQNFRKKVQYSIDNFVKIIESYFNDPYNKNICTIEKENDLLGLKFNKSYKMDMLEFLRGFTLAGWMDVASLRNKGINKYGWTMGAGDTFAGNITETKKYFLSLKELSEKEYMCSKTFYMLEHEKMIEVLKNLGIVADLDKLNFNKIKEEKGKIDWDLVKEKYGFDILKSKKEWENIYIREKKGKGVSDDNAIILAGFLADTFRKNSYIPSEYAVFSRILGAAIADRIDTYEKLSNIIFNEGQDSTLTQYANYLFKNKCKSWEYREFNQIREDLKDPNLLNPPIMLDYSIISSNVKYIIHSSMRRFGKEQEGTCMMEQLLIFADEISKGFENDPFKPNRQYAISEMGDLLDSNKPKEIKVGFYETPFNIFRDKVENDIQIILPPYKREENLKEYFMDLV